MLLHMTCNGGAASDVVFAIFEQYWWDYCAFALVSSYDIVTTRCASQVRLGAPVLNQHRYLTS